MHQDAPTTPPSPAPPVDRALMDQAVEWTREAGRHTLAWFRSADLPVDHKGDGSPVTAADREAETLLRERIAEAFPDDTVFGEEHEDRHGSSGRTWVIDPIDGTKAFSCGVATYSNLLYLEDEHGPAIGVINLPALGETVAAGRGLGCTSDGLPCAVDRTRTALGGSVLCTSGLDNWSTAAFARVNDAGVQLRTWGDAYGYALVATGRAAAMYDPAMAWWDLAPLTVILPEAGGVLTRSDGSADVATATMEPPYPFSAIASAGPLHEEWVQLLAD